MIQAGKIVVIHPIRGDFPIGHHLVAEPGVYSPYINPHGAVSVEINGEQLGLKPDEFEWLDQPAPGVYARFGGQILTDNTLIAHLEAVERLFGVDVSELSVVSTQDLQASDTIYRELASDEGERMYVVRRPAREER